MEAVLCSCPVDISTFDGTSFDGYIVDGEACCRFCFDTVIGAHIHQGCLSQAVSITAGAGSYATVVSRIEYAQQEPSVGASSPTPVEVEQALSVKTIQYKGMSACSVPSGKSYRVSGSYLFVDKVKPFVDGVVRAVSHVCTIVISEVCAECCGYVGTESGARRWTISHAHSLSYVGHQIGHCILLLLSLISCIMVHHVFPKYFGAHIDGSCGHGLFQSVVQGIGVGELGDGFSDTCWLLVIIHHLSQSCGHTSCGRLSRGAVSLVINGTFGIVGVSLVPGGGHQCGYSMLGALYLPASRSPLGGSAPAYVVVNEELDLVGISLQP